MSDQKKGLLTIAFLEPPGIIANMSDALAGKGVTYLDNSSYIIRKEIASPLSEAMWGRATRLEVDGLRSLDLNRM
jgi:hypothetical protein